MKVETLSNMVQRLGRMQTAEYFGRVVTNIDRWSAEGAIVVDGEIYTKVSRRPSRLTINEPGRGSKDDRR